jgi:hypothetical protein
MNDAQLHAPTVADIDNLGVLVTGPLRLFRSADLVDLSFGNDGSGRRVSRPGLGVDRYRNQNRNRKERVRFFSMPESDALAFYIIVRDASAIALPHVGHRG